MSGAPRGWRAGQIETRFSNLSPDTYNAKTRTVKAVLSVGAAVRRPYGLEMLKISPEAVDLTRLTTCGVPILDSHQIFGLGNVLGRLENAWFERNRLLGSIAFDDSEAGREAEGLVARGTVRGISIGYRVDKWEVRDEEGKLIDPSRDRMSFDGNYTFTAT